MSQYAVGIDSGSTMCKSVLWDGALIADVLTVKTGWNPRLSAEESLGVLLARNGLTRGEVCVAVTGYGREAIDFAQASFTEITCHAYGGLYLNADIQGIIDIGGQDSKVIQIHNGRVADFIMNDKCAAGTGRFMSMACETMGIPFEGIDALPETEGAESITSMCTVFAESEIIGLLAMQKDRTRIMKGVLESIARKIQQQSGKLRFTPFQPVLMTGGLSSCRTLMATIARTLGFHVVSHPYALFAGAVGAVICQAKNK